MIIKSNQNENDSVFSFLKKYISLSMFSIMLIVSLIFFFTYRSLEISRVTGSSINSLLQLSLSSDSLFDSIRRLSFQIYNDTDIAMLLNNSSPDPDSMLKSHIRLRNYASTSTNIVSVYVYSVLTDCFYSTLASTPRQTSANFFDTEAAVFVNEVQNTRILHPIPRKVVLPGTPDVPNNSINIYTVLYFGLPESSMRILNRAVIINVSEDWVRNIIELYNKDIEGSLYVINKDGILVSSIYNNELLQDISQEGFISGILDSQSDTGYFIESIDGKKSFVTYVYASKLQWFFIRAIPYGSVYSNIKRTGLISILLLVLNMSIGFVLAYLITGKAKKSVDDIINGLRKQITDSRSDMDRLKEEFLYSCLTNSISCPYESMKNDFEKYNIGFSAEKELFLVLLKIDHYHELCEKYKTYDISLLKQAIMKTASEIFVRRFDTETMDMKSDHIILVFNPNNISIGQIDTLIRLVQETAEKNIKLSISAVSGPSGYTFNDISLLYMEVKQASNYRMFYGHQCVIHTERLKTIAPEEYIYPAEIEKMLLDALMLSKVEQAMQLLNVMLDSAKGYPISILNSMLLRLTSSISSSLERVENISKFSIEYNFNLFLINLNKCETTSEIQGRFYEMFIHFRSALDEKKNSRYELLVNKVIEIIKQNYADESLCLNNISDNIGLSYGYLGKLFKTYTSKSVADYINHIRMENAIMLLERSDMSINEISKSIGFSSNNYFYTVFKKSFGMTPSEYRQKI